LASGKNVWNKGDFVPSLGNRLKIISNLVFPSNWGRYSKRDLVTGNWGKNNEENSALRTQGKELGPHSFENYKIDFNLWVIERRKQWANSF